MLELRQRSARDRTQSYFVEGVRFVVTASDADETFRSLVIAPKLLRTPLAQMLARRLPASGVPTLSVSPDEFARVSQAEEPSGIGAVLAQRWRPLRSVVLKHDDCWIALSDVRSPGNLGTLLRTAAAARARGVIVLAGGSADPFQPGTVRAAMGAMTSLSFVSATPAEFQDWRRRTRVAVLGATPQAAVDYRAVSYRQPVVLLLGSERKGLSEAQLALCDSRVRIPMSGGDSLNLAVAGSVLLYEVWNQRHPLHDGRAVGADSR